MGLANLLPQRKAYGLTPYRTVEDQLSNFMTFGYSGNAEREVIADDFSSIVDRAYKQCGPVFACIVARAMPFSEARFQFQEIQHGRPGRLVGTQALDLLDTPWPNATTGELLWRMEQDASLAGNFYATTIAATQRTTKRIRRMRPDWVSIVSGVFGEPDASAWSLNSEVLGYIYQPNVPNPPAPVFLTPAQVCHYSPIPDPDAQWRGMSWITPIIDEIQGDKNATSHKLKFFENGAHSNLVITYPDNRNLEYVKQFAKVFDEAHRGADKAYKVIHIGGGADIKAIGSNLQQLDFKAVQGASETRIAAASGVGAIIARFSEGLQGSSLNSGNYNAAKRQFADMTLRPLWRMACAALAKPEFVKVPSGSRLWFDDRDIQFLKEDRKDAADIQSLMAATIRQLVDAGFEPDQVIDAVEAGDLSRLIGRHSGLYSVQLRPSGGDDLTLAQQVEAAGALVRAGYDPAGALIAVGLDPIQHLGLLPITLQSAKQLELTPTQADAVAPKQLHVRIEPQTINVTTPDVKVDPPEVHVDVAAPIVNFKPPTSKKLVRTVERDSDGKISRVVDS